MKGGCNLKHYLCLVRKLLEKLVGCCKPFSDSWLIDWDNDCADDVWTLRLVLEPNDETKQKIIVVLVTAVGFYSSLTLMMKT